MKQSKYVLKTFSFPQADLAALNQRVPAGKRSYVIQALLRKFLAGEVTVTMPATEL